MGVFTRAVTTVAAGGVACVAYGTFIERRWYRVRRVLLPGLLPAGERLTILHISDLHLVPGQDHRVDFLDKLADFDHDVVVATGDLLGAPDAERLTADAMAPLVERGQPGLVVLGSNDLYAPVFKSPFSYFTRPERRVTGQRLDTGLLVDRLAEHGYDTLTGTHRRTTIKTPVGAVAVGGFDDPHLDRRVIPPPAQLVPDADDAVLRLGLVHAPYLQALDALVDAGYDLLLAGHTHGGQVRLPGIGALVANCDLPLSQARGTSTYRDRWLHVSPGLGHSRYAPFRFACRPEATLIEVTG